MRMIFLWKKRLRLSQRDLRCRRRDLRTGSKERIKENYRYGAFQFPCLHGKTQYSLSDDQTKLGRPEGFTINVREVYVSAGAGFVVAVTGAIMTMPGLPKNLLHMELT